MKRKLVVRIDQEVLDWITKMYPGSNYKDRAGIAQGDYYFHYPNLGDGIGYKPGEHVLSRISSGYSLVSFNSFCALTHQKDPQFGDWVLVKNNVDEEWVTRIFLADIQGSIRPIVTVVKGEENKFLVEEPYKKEQWDFIKQIDKEEISLRSAEILLDKVIIV